MENNIKEKSKNLMVTHGHETHPLNDPCKFCDKVKEEYETKSEKKEELKNEFFNRLADKLDEFFPKGECKERGKALMLNAYAYIIFIELIKKVKAEEREKIIKILKKQKVECSGSCGAGCELAVENLIISLQKI